MNKKEKLDSKYVFAGIFYFAALISCISNGYLWVAVIWIIFGAFWLASIRKNMKNKDK